MTGFEELVGIYTGHGEARVLQEAVRAGVFDATDPPATVADVADACGWDLDATRLLLDALCGMELLERDGDRYAPTDDAARYLTEGSEDTLVPIIRFVARQWDAWGRLSDALRTGEPVQTSASHTDDEALRRDFILGMRSIARGRGDAFRIPERVDLDGCARLLDLGCGPGTYSRHLLDAYPDLEATLFDLSETLAITREVVADWPEGIRDRVRFHEGDFLSDPLPEDHDVAFVSNILHGEPEDTARDLLADLFDALEPGGWLVLKDHFLDATRTRPRAGTSFAIVMLLFTGGRSYARDEVETWLTGTGFEEVREVPLGEDWPQSLLVARRP